LIMANVPITASASANGLNSLMRAFGGAIASAVLAAVIAAFTLTEGGARFPSLDAFRDMYWIAAGAAVVACLLAASIPSERERSPTSALGGSGAETVVHGRILYGGGDSGAAGSGVVTVTRMDGTPVDWARADSEGRYSVALPGSNRYLVVANARGWAPRAQVVEFHPGSTELHVKLADQLRVTGVVTADDAPVSQARVVLHRGVGEFLTSTATDAAGHFSMPLPAAGNYVVTAIDADDVRAAAIKIVVDIRAVTADIELA